MRTILHEARHIHHHQRDQLPAAQSLITPDLEQWCERDARDYEETAFSRLQRAGSLEAPADTTSAAVERAIAQLEEMHAAIRRMLAS